jgi:putative transposase
MSRKTYKFKLYNRDDTRRLCGLVDLSANIYNHCIALHQRYWRRYHKHLNKFKLNAHLAKLKNLPNIESIKHIRNLSRWHLVPSQAIQDVAIRIDKAYLAFFKYVREFKAEMKPRKVSPPGFKKSSKYKSFTTFQAGYKLIPNTNKIVIAKKTYSYWKSRELPDNAKIKNLTVKRTESGVYIYLCIEEPEVVPKPCVTGKSVGFDFGMKTFLVSSDRNDIEMPEYMKAGMEEMRRLSRLHRKTKGKHGALRSLSKAYERISNKRSDAHWKLAHQLTDAYDVLCFESLDLQSMHRSCQKRIHDYGFAQFLSILQYLAAKKGKSVVQVDKWFPSSQLCCECGHRQDMPLKLREFKCGRCGSVKSRDFNAAVNIEREGTSSLRKQSLTA